MDELINKQVEEFRKKFVIYENGKPLDDMFIPPTVSAKEIEAHLVRSMKKVGEEIIKGFLVFDKTEKREKWVVMLEWNMDNPRELIEVHTWPIAIYKAGYRLKNDPRGEKARRIDELEFISLTEGE